MPSAVFSLVNKVVSLVNNIAVQSGGMSLPDGPCIKLDIYLMTEFQRTQASPRNVKLAISSEQSNLGGLTWQTKSSL